MNKDLMREAGFDQEMRDVEEGRCPFCKEFVKQEDFRDYNSIIEFKISGLCMACQDSVFGK